MGEMEIQRNAFRMRVLAPFRGRDGELWPGAPRVVAAADLDAALGELAPELAVPLPPELHPAGRIEIRPDRLKAFHPDGLMHDLPGLASFGEAARPAAAAPLRSAGGAGAPSSRTPVDNILDMVSLPGEAAAQPPSGPVPAAAASGPGTLLRHIFGDGNFRALEEAWRGLRLMVQPLASGQGGIVEIVPAGAGNLEETLDALAGGFAENPPDIVLCCHEFDATARSQELLEQMARLGQTFMIPFVAAVGPGFFGLTGWEQLSGLPFLPHHLDSPVYAKWRRLRQSAAGAWLSLFCNRFLLRDPYGVRNTPRTVEFTEPGPLWACPVWAVGALMAQSFSRTGWPTRFAESRRRRVENLPLHDPGSGRPRPTEAFFDPDRAEQLLRCGITPLCSAPEKDSVWIDSEATAGGPSLAYQLLASRVARVLLECRELCADGLGPDRVEAELRRAFAAAWEASGHPPPAGLSLAIGAAAADGRLPVRVTLKPSAEILRGGPEVEMEFFW
jgi:hypothetical protein